MNLPLYQPFTNEWITFGLFFAGILALVGAAEFLQYRKNVHPESSRKFVHVLVGLLVAGCPFIFSSNIPPMTLAAIFIAVNSVSLKSESLKGMHTTERKTYGTVYFPVSFLILAACFWEKPITLILSMLIMTIADTVAGIAGSRAKEPRKFRLWKDVKSMEGSLAMFLTTFFIVYVGTDVFAWLFGAAFYIPLPILIGLAGFVAAAAAISEAVSCKGSDNLSVPLVSAIMYELYLINYTHGSLPDFMLWTLGTVAVFILAYPLRMLSASGTAGAFIMGVVVFGTNGISGVIPLIVFFALSSALSKFGSQKIPKESNRNVIQVLANGGAGTIILVWNFFFPFDGVMLMFLGSVAAAAADTWATEIGFFSRRKPRHIVSMKQVKKGTSGGVTFLGTIGSVLGAVSIAVTGFFIGIEQEFLWMIAAAGFAGSLADSVLGGTLQAKFLCESCNKKKESREHCGGKSQHTGGLKWIDNDMVNFLNTITGALIIYFISF